MDYLSENSNISEAEKDPSSVEEDNRSTSLETDTMNPKFCSASLDEHSRADKVMLSSKAVVPHRAQPLLQTISTKQSPTRDIAGFLSIGNKKFELPTNDIKRPACKVDSEHRPAQLPSFQEVSSCMWTASHAANCPSEDRSASLVNLLLQPLPPNFDSETQLPPLEPDYKTLIRLNLWAVIDGHGGGCVATYASEVMLPHIATSVSRALGCTIVDRGVCTVNGQLRDATALDLDGLITSDRSHANTNSIHYRYPYERSDSEEEGDGCGDDQNEPNLSEVDNEDAAAVHRTVGEQKQITSRVAGSAASVAILHLSQHQVASGNAASISSVKTSVKTAASPANRDELPGTHSPQEVAAVTRAITESFLAVDDGWINSIDPVATHQTSCQSNGRWNSGACALVVVTVQRLDWTSVSEPDRENQPKGPEKSRLNTSQNRDAARRRTLDYAARTKSASSVSTASSTSSLTTEEAANASGMESGITETEGEDDKRSYSENNRKRDTAEKFERRSLNENESLISPPGGCSCHCYRAHQALIYTAHVGDCRAVLLGSAPPRTIKVGDFSHHYTTDDESSHHSSDETECLSSSDHDADSSEDEDIEALTKSTMGSNTSATTSSYKNFPRRVVRQRTRGTDDSSGPFIALPPLHIADEDTTVEFDFETEIEYRERRRSAKDPSDSSASTQDSIDLLPLLQLPPGTRPIDLTTDHSAYNPAEVTAVLRRCNNAPRAISAGVGGGIKRVAGSLAVTRALGDAYLKTPLLSFLPYKRHAPYITARPEVNCRPLVKGGDKVLVLATDGVWERASGEDVLRWVRNFYDERLAESERRKNRRMNPAVDKGSESSNEDNNSGPDAMYCKQQSVLQQQEGSERALFESKYDNDFACRKRDLESSPVGAAGPMAKKRKRGARQNSSISYNVADVITRRVLNKVRRARNISSLQALMSLPQGRARRSKHDDITASVVDLSSFVS